ncbi:MAG: hypothetical protein OEW35_10000 [Gammaproteobacteria bacterium]|nr:hypothetical protein [Gammaproteobacteria bacterium]MDH4255137.1 hypothetical protein [Gammaproteobacteria bacterium]MDH5309829.1 hypothetical protein [Gammaproteobacteria bacterium]
MSASEENTPVHLWIVAVLAILWDAMGAFDYSATQLRLDFYMSQFTPEQLDYFYSFPAWADGAWAIAVWASLVAAFGLLLRRAWSVWLFGLAILALLATTIYNFGLSDGAAVMGEGATAFTAVIWLIAIGLFVYARVMVQKGVLH